jgi:hypothetical protein
MRHLMVFGLILALISITPASVLVCSSVLSPEMIWQLNEEYDAHFEMECVPQSSTINVSLTEFPSFLQSGFVAAIFLIALGMISGHRFYEHRPLKIVGCIISPPTPPPAPFALIK